MMAKANETEHLLSFFHFKEELDKKIKKADKKPVEIKRRPKNSYYEYDWEDQETQDKACREADNDEIDPELANMINGKEKENKRLQDKHKKELAEELEGEDV